MSSSNNTPQWRPPVAASSTPTVGLYSPSEPLASNRVPRLNDAISPLQESGVEFVFAKNALEHDGYMAGSVQQRVEDIHQLIDDPAIEILLASWGGKQCNQLLRHLDFEKIGRANKPISGFSDGCVLVNAITYRTGLFSFHGPNVAGKMNETDHIDLSPMSRRESPVFDPEHVFGNTAKDSWETWRGGTGEGRIFGGNLTTFVLGLVGTEFLPTDPDVVFFWEVLDERPQIVHQHLTCLANAGFFKNVRAMVVGDVNDVEPTDWKNKSIKEAVMDAVSDFNFPVAHVSTFGHKALENPAVPIGPLCRISTDEKSAKLLEAPTL